MQARSEGDDWALFLDFDGTLVEIVERPEAVVVEPDVPDLLTRLARRLGGALAVVSGRPIAFLDERLAPAQLDAAGLHGLEHRIAGRLTSCHPEDQPRLRAAVAEWQARIAPHPGLLVEDKGCSAALHWRLAPEHEAFARDLAARTAQTLGAEYRIQYGKAVAEILPAAAGKGRVIEMILDHPAYRGRRPVFIGDDLTDENGFAAVNARGGLSVRVGGGATVAQARLADPAAVRRCLARWAAGAQLAVEDLDPA